MKEEKKVDVLRGEGLRNTLSRSLAHTHSGRRLPAPPSLLLSPL